MTVISPEWATKLSSFSLKPLHEHQNIELRRWIADPNGKLGTRMLPRNLEDGLSNILEFGMPNAHKVIESEAVASKRSA
jgi:hypothetical protein